MSSDGVPLNPGMSAPPNTIPARPRDISWLYDYGTSLKRELLSPVHIAP